MSADRREKAKRLFHEALERNPSERAAFLDGLEALDPSLRKEVESLLDSHNEQENFLDKPQIEEVGDTSVLPTEDTASVTRVREVEEDSTEGRQIGPYRILQELGHGGMGVVYEAVQEKPVHRRVALKLIKLGMDTKQVIARFESERQALALMNHPNIASVYDAGATEQGRPYFAMEYVQGIPVTEYCDKHRLRIKERLGLFIAVCEGVQHAHQKGIIHRDLKPSNVLVTIQDDKPVPKIIDFGVAKATAHRLTERTVYTELGQLIGTPEYMSPEQAEMTGLDIDTRTDVYSLGVILYELLVGAQPFDATELRKAGFEGIRRIIREKEPLKPSTKVHSLSKTPTDSAKNRKIEPQVWERELRGDLDWITMKALEKDRTRRYGSPAELSGDVRRHLKHEPVIAGPPSQIYRMRKFIRRHRIGVGAATALFVALIGFAVMMTIQSARIARERDRTEQEAAKAKAISAFLQETLSSADPVSGLGREVTVLDALDAAVERIDDSFADEPEIDAAVRVTIGRTYLRLAQFEEAEPLLKRALEIRRQVLGEEHLDTAGSLAVLGLLHYELGHLDEAERAYQSALASYRRIEEGPIGGCLLSLAAIAERKGDLETAEAMLREALAKVQGDDAMVAWTSSALAGVLAAQGKSEAAEALYREALAQRINLYGRGHTLVAYSLHGLGKLISRQQVKTDGLPTGDCEAALPLLSEAVEIFDKSVGRENPECARARVSYGTCLTRLNLYENAEEQLLSAFTVLRDVLGEDDASTARAIESLVELYESWGKADKADDYRAMINEK